MERVVLRSVASMRAPILLDRHTCGTYVLRPMWLQFDLVVCYRIHAFSDCAGSLTSARSVAGRSGAGRPSTQPLVAKHGLQARRMRRRGTFACVSESGIGLEMEPKGPHFLRPCCAVEGACGQERRQARRQAACNACWLLGLRCEPPLFPHSLSGLHVCCAALCRMRLARIAHLCVYAMVVKTPPATQELRTHVSGASHIAGTIMMITHELGSRSCAQDVGRLAYRRCLSCVPGHL